MNTSSTLRALLGATLLLALSATAHAQNDTFDVVVYGGTSGGIAAAIQTRRMGKTVVLIEPTKHVGGLTTGGLGATDIGNKGAIGGISREFYQRVRKHYSDPAAWKFGKQPAGYDSGRRSEVGQEDAMWTFEPSVAEQIYRDMLAEAKVDVIYGERLDLKKGVTKVEGQIQSIQMESGRKFQGKRFIDATYEGDLLALAGVSYHVGREANSVYGETLNGVQTKNAVKHQLQPGVDPYVKAGDPSSGLLPGVHAGPPGEEGSGDKRVQAYNFRMCLTDVAENRLPITKPEGYSEARYELLLRNFEAGENRAPWNPIRMPNGKTDINNNFGFSTDNIGMNYDFPDGDYALREKIFAEHLQYQQGLLWTLITNPRVPKAIQESVAKWGPCKDEFTETAGWPHQLYVREARRMISDYVMAQSNCQGKRVVDDSVGLAAYTMDSHNVQRYVDEKGHARNEGDVQVGGFPPYGIAYRSIVPKEGECNNLLVPVCLSASHIAYGSIRMEPVFMVLGQSAATAACQSIDDALTVQRVDIKKLQAKLLEDKQILAWTGAAGGGIPVEKFSGVVIDDEKADKTGEWQPSNSIAGYVGGRYLHDGDSLKGQLAAKFTLPLPKPGKYEVRIAYLANPNRSKAVPVMIESASGNSATSIDQTKTAPIDKLWLSLGEFEGDKQIVVTIKNEGTTGHVIVDAVQALAK